MDADIEDAMGAAPGVRPRAAVPIHMPRAVGPASALACTLVGVLLFEARTHAPLAHAKTIDPIEMAPDDLDDVKDFLKQIDQREQGDETKAAIEEFNKLVDDLANKRLDRTEAFRRIEPLEERLFPPTAPDPKPLQAQLENIAD